MNETHLSDLAEMMEQTGAALDQLTEADHLKPTPCAEYNVAQLAEHIATWIQVFDSAVNDRPVPFDPTDHRIESGWGAIVRRSAGSIHDGLRTLGIDRPMTMTGSPLPGAFVMNMMLMEYVGHGWDLAKATNRPVPFSNEQAAIALTAAQTIIEPQYRGSGMFGEIVETTEAASAMDRFVAFLGRDPNWAHPSQ